MAWMAAGLVERIVMLGVWFWLRWSWVMLAAAARAQRSTSKLVAKIRGFVWCGWFPSCWRRRPRSQRWAVGHLLCPSWPLNHGGWPLNHGDVGHLVREADAKE
ncbi:hypothetical protein BC826DRAFT_276519 [Russula brevipes]|nr:hypothetical protein BC826DRAFT_276519 [Russula brevipes]